MWQLTMPVATLPRFLLAAMCTRGQIAQLVKYLYKHEEDLIPLSLHHMSGSAWRPMLVLSAWGVETRIRGLWLL